MTVLEVLTAPAVLESTLFSAVSAVVAVSVVTATPLNPTPLF